MNGKRVLGFRCWVLVSPYQHPEPNTQHPLPVHRSSSLPLVVNILDEAARGGDARGLVGDYAVALPARGLRYLRDAKARQVVRAHARAAAFGPVVVVFVLADEEEAGGGCVVAEALREVGRLARAAQLVDDEHAVLDPD